MTRGSDHVDIGRWVPVPALRVALVVVAAAAFAVAPLPWALITVALAVAGAAAPASRAAWVAVVALAGSGLAHPQEWSGALALILLAAHAMHVLAGLSTALPATGRVQLRALAPSVRRFVLLQVPAQVVLAAVAIVGPGGRGVVMPVPLAVVAAVAAGFAAVLALRLLARGRR